MNTPETDAFLADLAKPVGPYTLRHCFATCSANLRHVGIVAGVPRLRCRRRRAVTFCYLIAVHNLTFSRRLAATITCLPSGLGCTTLARRIDWRTPAQRLDSAAGRKPTFLHGTFSALLVRCKLSLGRSLSTPPGIAEQRSHSVGEWARMRFQRHTHRIPPYLVAALQQQRGQPSTMCVVVEPDGIWPIDLLPTR
jgi:hypothetical protein